MDKIHAGDKNQIIPRLSDVNGDDEAIEAQEVLNSLQDETKKTKKHTCADCGYKTYRKNTLRNHQAETCKVRRQKGLLEAKNSHCKFCLKTMRHNGLRAHVRHFIKMLTENRKPKGKHAGITKEEFIAYLSDIKSKS